MATVTNKISQVKVGTTNYDIVPGYLKVANDGNPIIYSGDELIELLHGVNETYVVTEFTGTTGFNKANETITFAGLEGLVTPDPKGFQVGDILLSKDTTEPDYWITEIDTANSLYKLAQVQSDAAAHSHSLATTTTNNVMVGNINKVVTGISGGSVSDVTLQSGTTAGTGTVKVLTELSEASQSYTPAGTIAGTGTTITIPTVGTTSITVPTTASIPANTYVTDVPTAVTVSTTNTTLIPANTVVTNSELKVENEVLSLTETLNSSAYTYAKATVGTLGAATKNAEANAISLSGGTAKSVATKGTDAGSVHTSYVFNGTAATGLKSYTATTRYISATGGEYTAPTATTATVTPTNLTYVNATTTGTGGGGTNG